MDSRLRVIVSGMIAGDPHQGGATWSILQYVLGLRQLGHDVWLIEPVDELRPDIVRYFEAVVAAFELGERAALLERESTRTAGCTYARLEQGARDADLLLNVSGMLKDERLVARVGVRAFLDLDPAFTQLWHFAEGIDMGFVGHDRFVTVGLALGDPDCPVPTGGVEWLKTVPPVVLDYWPTIPAPPDAPTTTIGNWRGYGSVEWEGVLYGQKAHSMRELLPLASRSPTKLLLAFGIHPDETRDLDALAAHGWQLADPLEVAGSPTAYADFIRSSHAELGVAKSGYVHSRCGWFSDRSTCYLACGRPVVAQDTGFAGRLPTGEGLLAFDGVDEAVASLEALERDYEVHARGARALAEEVFRSDLVLGRLLETLT